MQTGQSPTSKPRRRRRLGKKLLLLVVVSFLCFVLLEVGVRLLLPQPPSWLNLYREHPKLPMAFEPNAHALVDTGETHWHVYTDASGHRRAKDKKAGQQSKGTALWLGDSFTFGHGVDYEQTWVGLLDARSDARYSHLNCGVPGYGPTQYKIVLEEALQAIDDVSIVFVVTYLGNDFHDTIWEKKSVIRNGVVGDTGSFRSMIARNLHSYRLATRVMHRLAGRVSKEQSALVDLRTPAAWQVPPMSDALTRFADGIRGIARICEERSIPLVAIVVPHASMVTLTRKHGAADSVDTADERGPLVRALNILSELGLRVVDTTPELAEHDAADLYYRFDGHFRPLGHEVVEGLLLRSVPELQK